MDRQLTVLIPCKNERHHIRACIDSVAPLADEILIADSGSTDGTLEIVRQTPRCRIIERDYVHSGDFKNWAIPQAAHDWVLIVDADERVPELLVAEIRQVLALPRPRDGYWILRENYFLGHPIRYSGWNNDKVLRLFRRDLGRYVGETDHAEVQIATGRVGRLRARLRHYSYRSYDQYFQKFHRYTTWAADGRARAGRRPSLWRMLLVAPARFLQTYFLRLGFLDGAAGVQVCMLTAFYSFMKEARLWESQRAGTRPRDQEETARCRSAEPAGRSALACNR